MTLPPSHPPLSFPSPYVSIGLRAPVAQLDRAWGCGPQGRRFKSSRAYQVFPLSDPISSSLLCLSPRPGATPVRPREVDAP